MLIRNARAYLNRGFRKTDILIRAERIAKVALGIDAGCGGVLDAHGLVVLPGLIDLHAHFREPGQTQKEDFLSGSRAALAGGYCLAYDMPNNMPRPTTTKEALDEKKMLAQKALCEIRFHFGATKTNFMEVKGADPESLKFYLDETTGNLLLDNEKCVFEHMRRFPRKRQIFVHSELEKTRMVIRLARKAGRRIHITHVPNLQVLDAARSWKLATVDCTPHHLFLDREDAENLGALGRVNPPLQEKAIVSGLWKRLDEIDAIATDHAPHLKSEKLSGAAGFPGLETALALFLDAHSKGRIGLEWIAQRFSENPAAIMGIGKEYGKIAPGYFANLTFVDTEKAWVVRGEKLYTKCKWSPFEGMKLRGKVVRTMCRGKTAFEDG